MPSKIFVATVALALIAASSALLIKVQPHSDSLCTNAGAGSPSIQNGFDTSLSCNIWVRQPPVGAPIFDSFEQFQCFPDRVFYTKHAGCSSCVGCLRTVRVNNSLTECHGEPGAGGTVYMKLLPVHPIYGTVYVGTVDGTCGPSACASSPCQNGGVCTDSTTTFNTFSCSCPPGFAGPTCSINVDECSSSPCQNGGTCVDGNNGYECNCAAGYAGGNCQDEIDECASSPCLNGDCSDLIAQYSCTCTPGYEGVNCDLETDECSSSPCVNGDCTDELNAYSCTCDVGYEGVNCDVDTNECASNPCQNGGTCSTPQIGSFVCTCSNSWHGVLCAEHANDKDKDKHHDGFMFAEDDHGDH